MFSVFVPSESSLKKHPVTDPALLPDNAVWIDLLNPTMAEDRAVERLAGICLLYTSPSPRDRTRSRMPSSA